MGEHKLIATAPTCGSCEFGYGFREGIAVSLKGVECFGVPPTPLVMGQGPGGLAMGLMRPRIDMDTPACALHRLRDPLRNRPVAGEKPR